MSNNEYGIIADWDQYVQMPEKKWIPVILMPDLYAIGSCAKFWGFDERVDKTGKKVDGFFLDIETYDEQNIITIMCPGRVLCVRWTGENGRVNDGRRDNQPDLPAAFVYRIEKSDFSEWLTVQSSGIFENICHYELSTSDDIIDVLTNKEPILFS